MIQFQHINHQYPSGEKVIHDLSLTIPEGKLIALIGPSGAGKSTLLKMVNRLVEPTEGTIFVDGKNVTDVNPVELRRHMGYIIQQIGLLPHMTIWENATLVPRLCKMAESEWKDRVVELMDTIGLPFAEYGDRYPTQLSGGQQQRIGVVRALASNPPIILLDEPFSALDPISREQLQEETLRLQQKFKKTMILVTHDIDEALKMADQICILKKGRIIQFDTPEILRSKPRNEFVRQFIGEERLQNQRSLKDVLVAPVTINSYQRLWEGLLRLQRRRVDTLVVVDDNGTYQGVVTLWDLETHRKEDDTIKISELMREDYPTLTESTDLNTAISVLRSQNLSSLPVLSEKNKLVGVLTRAGLIEMIADEMAPVEGGGGNEIG
ncbi:MAG: betaine/proline/choline family ABC transporter ATP-binding protein [Negativicutes bacterium]|jgi:osmoprotectant transport system ATP-binding protein|nr:betaine/proline/choline family ABC transporter ATP-binding protein [Negativicutes bacterium]